MIGDGGRAGPGRGTGYAEHGETNAMRAKAEPALMEAVVERSNMQRAYQRVVRNKGAAGVDGLGVSELRDLLRQHWPTIKAKLLEGRYYPQPVRQVSIPKPNSHLDCRATPGKEGFQPSKYDSPTPHFPCFLNHFRPPSPPISHNPVCFLLIHKPNMTHYPPIAWNTRIISEQSSIASKTPHFDLHPYSSTYTHHFN